MPSMIKMLDQCANAGLESYAAILTGCAGARVMMPTPKVHLDVERDFYGALLSAVNAVAAPVRGALKAALLAGVAAAAIGCANVARVENQRIAQHEPGTGYGAQLSQGKGGGDLRVLLAFSGGGTRAAALAYGVLKELRDTEIVRDSRKRRMLDFVTQISSVSGGSFTSAYYGLHGDRIFEDFEERFLRRNIQGRLVVNLLRPFQLLRLAFTRYTRSDLAMDIYDKEVFDGATFTDLANAGGPRLYISATDIDIGTVFTFIQPYFDLICSDLSKMRVSQAVAASSAVPVAFSPLRLENFAGSCGFPEPAWIREALENPTSSRRTRRKAVFAATYLDPEQRPNIFLLDGGIADNMGVRRVLADVTDTGGFWEMVEAAKIEVPTTVLYIVVNAQAVGEHDWVQDNGGPTSGDLLGAVTGVGMHRYNFETIELLRGAADEWSREAAERGHRLDTYVSEVAFDDLGDAEEREFFNGIATSFDLDDETIDRLIEVGGRLLRESPDFRSFMARGR